MEGKSTTAPVPPTGEPGGSYRWLTWLRRGLAGLTVLALAVVVLLSYVPGSSVASCREAVAGSGTVRICAPIGTDDIVAVGVVLLAVVMLLWPDLSEFSIFGLLSLKKEVAANRRQLAEAGRVTEGLSADVRYINLALQPPPNVGQVASEARERVDSFTIDAAIAPAPARVLSDERAAAEAEFMRLASEIDVYVRAVTLPPNEAGALLKEAQARGAVPFGIGYGQLTALRMSLRVWQEQFSTELRSWAVLRNVLVHGGADRLSDADMRSANELGGLLLTAAQKAVRAA